MGSSESDPSTCGGHACTSTAAHPSVTLLLLGFFAMSDFPLETDNEKTILKEGDL